MSSEIELPEDEISAPRTLFLTTADGDYLQDQILIGLRELLGGDCVDFPRKDILYQDCTDQPSELYGRGFTIWKHLDTTDVTRKNVPHRIEQNEFDLIVFGSIHRQKSTFWDFKEDGIFEETNAEFIFLDGEDHITRHNRVWQTTRRILDEVKRHSRWRSTGVTVFAYPIFEPALEYGPYFKRELTKPIYDKYKEYPLFSTSFGIPRGKIRLDIETKTKRFPKQVQCDEAYKLEEVRNHSVVEHVFDEEEAYYNDLAQSKYGITQKKAGWDVMRHYEIAANLTVPCFNRLHDKPKLCAPHGLRDMHNCIAFDTADELRTKLDLVEQNEMYDFLLSNVRSWIQQNTCTTRTKEMLSQAGIL